MPDIRKILIIIFTVLMTACGGCTDDPDPVDEGLKITGVSIPSTINVPVNGLITVTGQGFALNDQIQFVLTTDAGSKYYQLRYCSDRPECQFCSACRNHLGYLETDRDQG